MSDLACRNKALKGGGLSDEKGQVSSNMNGALALFRFCKAPLAMTIGMAAVSGATFYGPQNFYGILGLFSGVTLASMAGGIFNNLVEQAMDRRLSRTRWRSEVVGRWGETSLALLGAGIVAVGFLLLYFSGSTWASMGWVGAGLLLYNGIYTPLKRVSTLSLFPGALCGVAAIFAGWTFAGGDLWRVDILSAALVMGIWQIPHTMAQNLMEEGDLKGLGRPSLPKLFKGKELSWLSLLWTLLYNFSLCHLLFMAHLSVASAQLLLVNAFCITPLFAWSQFFLKKPALAFHLLNVSLALFLLSLIL